MIIIKPCNFVREPIKISTQYILWINGAMIASGKWTLKTTTINSQCFFVFLLFFFLFLLFFFCFLMEGDFLFFGLFVFWFVFVCFCYFAFLYLFFKCLEMYCCFCDGNFISLVFILNAGHFSLENCLQIKDFSNLRRCNIFSIFYINFNWTFFFLHIFYDLSSVFLFLIFFFFFSLTENLHNFLVRFSSLIIISIIPLYDYSYQIIQVG